MKAKKNLGGLSKTTHHRWVACEAKPQKPSHRSMVVFEHAQKFSTYEKRIGFQPPVKNWWKISDIFKLPKYQEVVF